MTEDSVDIVIRQAIGGDADAIARIAALADTSTDAIPIVMAALLEQQPERLERALTVAASRRDRQVVEIARGSLDGAGDLVDALARDHLVDYPDSLIVAWVASHAAVRARREGLS